VTDIDRPRDDGEPHTDPDPRTGTHPSRRRLLRATVGLATLTAVAGCSGGGGDGDDGNGGGTPTATATETTAPTATETTTPTTTPDGTTSDSSGGMTSEVSALAIVSAEQDVSEETDSIPAGIWMVHLEIRNAGDRETDAFEYEYDGTLYDADGNRLGRITGKSSTGSGVAAPGEVGTVTLVSRDVDPENVANFGVTLGCAAIWDGVYCEDD
jgi:hypothetical protein